MSSRSGASFVRSDIFLPKNRPTVRERKEKRRWCNGAVQWHEFRYNSRCKAGCSLARCGTCCLQGVPHGLVGIHGKRPPNPCPERLSHPVLSCCTTMQAKKGRKEGREEGRKEGRSIVRRPSSLPSPPFPPQRFTILFVDCVTNVGSVDTLFRKS